MIYMDKKYRTKDGKEVRLYGNDGRAPGPIHGAILLEDGWQCATWSENGTGSPTRRHLIEVVMIPEYWVVLQESGKPGYVTNDNPALVLTDGAFAIHHPAQEKPHGTS